MGDVPLTFSGAIVPRREHLDECLFLQLFVSPHCERDMLAGVPLGDRERVDREIRDLMMATSLQISKMLQSLPREETTIA
jgi:hypothetical protein